ncbi:MAG: 2,3-bisphosphoglycerate-independent phosphoglycerate mutase [Candidatus Delongbacteria bacterium]|nr:2,3-bisphosphoglycerate-independent phosphoglycerate mutase [Candidatus Delongbacteria bacterium]
MKRPVVLIIRDGWGISDRIAGNAVRAAHTPNLDRFSENFPRSLLACSGEAVGLPAGYQGSSEVGHLNMGAGRIVIQELKRIDTALKSGDFFDGENWLQLIRNWRDHKSRLHLMGLIQDEGVHAHQEHLFHFIREARSAYAKGEIVIHLFLDGRDTPPRSASEFVDKLNQLLVTVGGCKIGTLMGRYYAMDRSENWKLTDSAFACIVDARGRVAANALQAINESYRKDTTPDGVPMFDEYIPPHVLNDYEGLRNGDSVLHTNYRQDRAIQLTRAFVADDYPGQRVRRPKSVYMGLTRYYDEFTNYLMEPIDAGGGLSGLLGEIVSQAGLKQLRIAETQKFRHVTSFFNGKSTRPFPGETQVEVPGRYDPATFASHPEMEAYLVTDKLLTLNSSEQFDFIVVNYANGDMVGHTGDLKAATRAIEVVDECVGRVADHMLQRNAHLLITADHGNAEEMTDEHNAPKTSHTMNPVDLIYLSADASSRRLQSRGKLSDIAPTVLELLGLEVPSVMTARSLLLP